MSDHVQSCSRIGRVVLLLGVGGSLVAILIGGCSGYLTVLAAKWLPIVVEHIAILIIGVAGGSLIAFLAILLWQLAHRGSPLTHGTRRSVLFLRWPLGLLAGGSAFVGFVGGGSAYRLTGKDIPENLVTVAVLLFAWSFLFLRPIQWLGGSTDPDPEASGSDESQT